MRELRCGNRQIRNVWFECAYGWCIFSSCLPDGSLGQSESVVSAASFTNHSWRLSKIEDSTLGELEMLHIHSKIYIKSVYREVDEYLKCIRKLVWNKYYNVQPNPFFANYVLFSNFLSICFWDSSYWYIYTQVFVLIKEYWAYIFNTSTISCVVSDFLKV